MRRALVLSALLLPCLAPVSAGRAEPAPAAQTAPLTPGAAELAEELTALSRRPGLSQHAADLVAQARGVQRRLQEATAAGANQATQARLTRLFHALLRAADASDARDRERASYAASARRLADVEAQLASSDAGVAR